MDFNHILKFWFPVFLLNTKKPRIISRKNDMIPASWFFVRYLYNKKHISKNKPFLFHSGVERRCFFRCYKNFCLVFPKKTAIITIISWLTICGKKKERYTYRYHMYIRWEREGITSSHTGKRLFIIVIIFIIFRGDGACSAHAKYNLYVLKSCLQHIQNSS